MEKQTHPIEELANEITRRGLMVFDDVTSLHVYKKPYVAPFIVICLNHRGWLKTVYDMKTVEFHPHDLAIVFPGHILVAKETSDDYLASLLVVSPQFLEKLSNSHPSSYLHIEYYNSSTIHLSDERYKSIYGHFHLLQAINQLDYPERDELLAKQLEIGARLMEIYIQENNAMALKHITANQELLNRFQNAIVKHSSENRKVQFYADLLCLSPKYFGTIVKEQTGFSASEWITRYVIVQAKTLLRYRNDLNIQQISFQLGFSDPAAFTRYFKANTGLSPKEYRAEQ